VELVGAGFGDVIDLRRSIPALVHGVRKRIDGHLRDRVQAEHEIGREAAIEVRKRIIRLQAVDDVSVGEGRQAIEFHVAVTIRSADEIVATARRIDQSARRELNGIAFLAN
jgi:hypothetical protein